MKFLINIQYDFEYQGFVVDCPSLPGCMSQGKTKGEAIKNIREAIRGYVSVLKKHSLTAPLQIIPSSYMELTV